MRSGGLKGSGGECDGMSFLRVTDPEEREIGGEGRDRIEKYEHFYLENAWTIITYQQGRCGE